MNKNVTVIGLGYVGYPLFETLCTTQKYTVFGLDINQELIASLKKKFHADHCQVTSKPDECLPVSDYIVVCVATPVRDNFSPDLGAVRKIFQTIAQYLKKGQVIILESTVAPGTCEKILLPILESSGLQVNRDFWLSHCPERINPGDSHWNMTNIPRVVGSSDSKGLRKTLNFYTSFLLSSLHPMTRLIDAESTKMVENIFRDVNIALVNELAQAFDLMQIDTMAVIEGAATKPFSFIPHYPGCGVGGDCIATDPYYFIEVAELVGFSPNLISTARKINESMPEYTVKKIRDWCEKEKKAAKKIKILQLGLTYKPSIADIRRSPAIKVYSLLTQNFRQVDVYDPYLPELSTVKNIDQKLKEIDVVVLCTAHRQFLNLLQVKRLAQTQIKVIIDGRNCLPKEKIEAIGIQYLGIGR